MSEDGGTETFLCSSPEDTAAVAARVAARVSRGGVVFLKGPLGAGKTWFAKGLFAALGVDPDDVTSPTFQIVHRYRRGELPLYHVDLFRLETAAAIATIGLDEILDSPGVVVIEWAERLTSGYGEPDVRVEIEDLGGEARRIIVASLRRERSDA